MSWTAPRTWVTGETLTSTLLNTHLRDNLIALRPGYGTALPGSPGDGDEFVLVDSVTTPTYMWQLRYNASNTTANKWEWIGGEAFVQVNTGELTASTTYVALGTPGPAITVPRPGDYVIGIGFQPNQSGTDGAYQYMSYDIGATTAVDADATFASAIGWSTGQNTIGVGVRFQKKTIAASLTLTAKYRQSGGVGHNFSARWMSVRPVAIS